MPIGFPSTQRLATSIDLSSKPGDLFARRLNGLGRGPAYRVPPLSTRDGVVNNECLRSRSCDPNDEAPDRFPSMVVCDTMHFSGPIKPLTNWSSNFPFGPRSPWSSSCPVSGRQWHNPPASVSENRREATIVSQIYLLFSGVDPHRVRSVVYENLAAASLNSGGPRFESWCTHHKIKRAQARSGTQLRLLNS